MEQKRNLFKWGLSTFFLLMLVFIVACGNSEKTSSSANNRGGETDREKEEKKETFTLTFNSAFAPPAAGDEKTSTYLATVKFSELIEERTDGRVTIELFYNNQLVGQNEALDALSAGTVDFIHSSAIVLTERVPEGGIENLPFAFMGEEHLYHIYNETEIGEMYNETLLQQGGVSLIHQYASVNGLMSKKPIASVADLKGLVVNSPNQIMNAFFSAAGAGLASVPLAEQYEAMLRGTVDVIVFPYYALEKYKLHEVVDYISAVPMFNPASASVIASKGTWDKLPADLQEIISEVSKEIELETVEASKAQTIGAFEFVKNETDVEITPMTEEAFNEFVQLSQEISWKKLAEINDRTKRVVEILKEENEKWLKNHPELHPLKAFEQFQ